MEKIEEWIENKAKGEYPSGKYNGSYHLKRECYIKGASDLWDYVSNKIVSDMNELYRFRARQDGFDDYCEAHGIPYDNECPECANLKQKDTTINS